MHRRGTSRATNGDAGGVGDQKRGRKDEEGLSAHRRKKGREFTKPVAEFGECVCVLRPPATVLGKDNFDAKWKEGFGHHFVWRVEIRLSAQMKESSAQEISGESQRTEGG